MLSRILSTAFFQHVNADNFGRVDRQSAQRDDAYPAAVFVLNGDSDELTVAGILPFRSDVNHLAFRNHERNYIPTGIYTSSQINARLQLHNYSISVQRIDVLQSAM